MFIPGNLWSNPSYRVSFWKRMGEVPLQYIGQKGCSEKHPLYLPQENAVDVYPKVRLEAGALHLANYLIRIRGLLLIAKIGLFPGSTSKKRIIARLWELKYSSDFRVFPYLCT